MTQAIIKFTGHQFLVTPGDVFTVDQHLDQKIGSTMDISDVLLLINDDQVKIGKPHLANTTVTCEIIKLAKGPKINVFRYKAKSRYRRRLGHRQPQTQLKVLKINTQ